MTAIVVTPYNPEWATIFQQLKAVYENLLQGLIVDVQHVGSTSVLGLAAKPVVDIDIIINARENLPSIIELLATIGYEHKGDWGVPDREAFKPINDGIPTFADGKVAPKHNLYVCIAGSEALKNHLALRDYLRDNPTAVKQYGELKMKLVEQFPHDMDSYIDGKTDFIINILSKSGFENNTLDRIAAINKK